MGATKHKTKRKSKRKTKCKSKLSKLSIKDVPFSRQISLGSKATRGTIDYYYLHYHTFDFIKEILKRDKSLKQMVCIPNIGKSWWQAFLAIDFKSTIPVQVVNLPNKLSLFLKKVKQCMKHRLIPINLQLRSPKQGSHANMIVMDTHRKTVELFEPHGGKHNDSTLDGEKRAYYKVRVYLRKFFKQHFPDYKFITPEMYSPYNILQNKSDAYSGMCVTWCILYLHYRILNPDISRKQLVRYLDKKINQTKLLQYAQYIEDVLKHKA